METMWCIEFPNLQIVSKSSFSALRQSLFITSSSIRLVYYEEFREQSLRSIFYTIVWSTNRVFVDVILNRWNVSCWFGHAWDTQTITHRSCYLGVPSTSVPGFQDCNKRLYLAFVRRLAVMTDQMQTYLLISSRKREIYVDGTPRASHILQL